jgi:hypothetical protein
MELDALANTGFERYGIRFAPLTLAKIAQLQAWARDRVMDAGFAYLYAHPMPPATEQRYVSGLIETAMGLTLWDGIGKAQVESLDGRVKALELASDGAFRLEAMAARITAREPGLPASIPELIGELRLRLMVAAGDLPPEALSQLGAAGGAPAAAHPTGQPSGVAPT